MFHIETECDSDKFWQFVAELGPQTTRQFDQFNHIERGGDSETQMWEDMMNTRHNFYGKLDGELIAYGFLQRFPKKKNVVSLGMVMSDKHHGHGYGRKMYEHVVNWGLERYTKIWSAVYEDNDRVLHIHKSLGFVLEGIFVNELNDGRSIFSVARFRTGIVEVKREELNEKWRRLR